MMYDRFRQIHLFVAFVLTIFILMYFVTGFVMILEDVFKRTDTAVSTKTMEIHGVRSLTGEELVLKLKKDLDVSGQYQIREAEEVTLVHFRRPGTETDVKVSHESDSITVTSKRKNGISTMHQFHRLHGYRGGWNYVAWAFMYDLSSLSMIIFALTGVYLWYKTERTRWPGWVLLIGFTFLTAYTLYYLRVLQ